MTMKAYFKILLLAMCLVGCTRQGLPPFGNSHDWVLQGNTVVGRDLRVDFGGNDILANAGNGQYDLNFVTSQAQFDAYEPRLARYLTDVVGRIPLRIDSIDVMLADQFMIVSPSVAKQWMPDYVRRADGATFVVEANPLESMVQPHDQLWRNLVIDKRRHQIVVVDRMVKNGRHYAIIYVLQSETGSSPLTRNSQYDITSLRNMQATGTQLEALWNISIAALQSAAGDMSYADCIARADACFMRQDYRGASDAFEQAFGWRDQVQGQHLYNAACAAARAGQHDLAFERLNMRLRRDANWYVDDPNRDQDLASLHDDPRWKTYCDTITARRDSIERDFDKPLQRQLLAIGRSDQQIRYEFLAAYNSQPREQARVDSLTRVMQRIDSVNQAAICHILDTRGFVGRDLVGDASDVYWLVIQHAPVELQRRYLDMFVQAMHRGEMSPSQIAMMDDRIAMFEGRPQKFGTQVVEDAQGKRVIYQLINPAKVDQWRAEYGLGPLSDYKRQMGIN